MYSRYDLSTRTAVRPVIATSTEHTGTQPTLSSALFQNFVVCRSCRLISCSSIVVDIGTGQQVEGFAPPHTPPELSLRCLATKQLSSLPYRGTLPYLTFPCLSYSVPNPPASRGASRLNEEPGRTTQTLIVLDDPVAVKPSHTLSHSLILLILQKANSLPNPPWYS